MRGYLSLFLLIAVGFNDTEPVSGSPVAHALYRRSAHLVHLESLADEGLAASLQDCILKDLNCPPDGSLDFRRGRIVLKIFRSIELTDRCSCDLSEAKCLRGCVYNYLVKSSAVSAAWISLSMGGDAETAKAAAQTAIQGVEAGFKPCLIEDQNCDLLAQFLKPAELTATLAKLRVLVDLPADCQCDIEDDDCARKCFYSIVKKYLDAGLLKELGFSKN